MAATPSSQFRLMVVAIIAWLSINSGGSGYEPGDTITVSGEASLNGASPAHDLTITVNNIVTTSGAILHIDNISINRANEPQTIIEGIDISSKMLQLRPLLLLQMQKNKLNSGIPIWRVKN